MSKRHFACCRRRRHCEDAPIAVQMAGACVAFLPILIAYLIMQRHFVESFASTGIKG